MLWKLSALFEARLISEWWDCFRKLCNPSAAFRHAVYTHTLPSALASKTKYASHQPHFSWFQVQCLLLSICYTTDTNANISSSDHTSSYKLAYPNVYNACLPETQIIPHILAQPVALPVTQSCPLINSIASHQSFLSASAPQILISVPGVP